MIWNSVFLMTLIDLALISLSLYLMAVLHRYRQAATKLGLAMGARLILFGLLVTALFHFLDLLTMYVLPVMTSHEQSMAAMTNLHLNWSWVSTLISVGAIAGGLLYLVQILIPKASLETQNLEALARSRTQELTEANEKLKEEIAQRKRIADDLLKKEAILQEAQRIAHIGSWEWDLPTGQVEWSEEMYRIHQVNPDEFEDTQKLLTTAHHEDLQKWQANLSQAQTEVENIDLEAPIVWPDKSVRIVNVKGKVEYDASGNAVRIVGTTQDITELKQANEALRKSEERFELAMKGSNDGFWDWPDMSIDRPWWSPRFFQLLGYEPGEINASVASFEERLHPDDKSAVDEAVRAHLEQCRPYDVECRLRTKSDEYRWFHSRGQALWDEQGQPTRMSGSLRDITNRKRAEEALQESEEKYRQIVETADEGIWAIDAGGRTTFVNPRMAEMLGYRVEEMSGAHLFDFMDQAARAQVAENLKRRGQGIKEDHEFKFLCKDGSTLWTLMATNPLYDQKGVYSGALAMVTDMTERKQAETALRESEERFQRLSEAAFEGIGISEDGKIIDANNQLADMFGYKLEDLIGRAAFDLVAPESRELVAKNIQEGYEEAYEHLAVKKDGTIFPVEVHGKALPQKGRSVRVTAIQDITDRKQAEEALRESEKKYKALAELSPVGIFHTSPEGQCLYVNERWSEISGLSQEQALGDGWAEAVHPDDRNWVVDEWSQAVEKSRGVASEFRFRRPNGEIAWVYGQVLAEIDNSGKITGYVGSVTDITERKQAEEELQKTKELLERLINSSVDGILAYDHECRYTVWNPAMEAISGINGSDTLGKCAFDVFPFLKDIGEDRFFNDSLAGKTAIARDRPYVIPETGQKGFFEGHYSPLLLESGQVIGGLAVIRDITERKEAEGQLQQTSGQLRALAAHLQSVREEERIAIAREMHDELGQVLTALKMDLSIMGKEIEEDQLLNDPAQIQNEIDSMLKLIDTTIHKIRRIITQLRPEVLDNLGLIPALEWHAQEIGTRTGMKYKFRSNIGEIELKKELSTAIFRIFQEALTNIVRHAGATQFDVYLAKKNGAISLRISDNGVGITTDKVENSQTFGLLGMKERALVLGGAVEVSGVAGKGTTVLASIPIK